MTGGGGQAIVLAAHGSRRPGAMEPLVAFRDRLAKLFPHWRVTLARTMGRQHGAAATYGGILSVAEVVQGLLASGVRRLALQSLHVVPGEEYQEMLSGLGEPLQTVGNGPAFAVGAPLLAEEADVARVARAVLRRLDDRRGPDAGLVVMGHGAPSPGGDLYDAFGRCLTGLDPLAHCGVLPLRRGEPCRDIERIRRSLLDAGVQEAWLVPLFTVAGVHACSDLAGEKTSSWKGVLEASGIACQADLTGLIEDAACQDVWREHLVEALASFG